MSKSIFEDIKDFFQNGNMLTKIILFNIIVFVLLAIVQLIFRDSYNSILAQLVLSGDFSVFLKHPWTIITSTFVNTDVYNFIFLMFVYYWFGNIVGDFIGDKKILPLFILGAFFGILGYLLYSLFGSNQSVFYGSSPAVLSAVGAAMMIAPRYKLKLLLLGNIPLLYIGAIVILIVFGKSMGTGNYVALFGGLGIGVAFIYLLKNGIDLSKNINNFIEKIISLFQPRKNNNLVIVSRGDKNKAKSKNKISQEIVDKLLDKVKSKGYKSLTENEKETLFKASNSEEGN